MVNDTDKPATTTKTMITAEAFRTTTHRPAVAVKMYVCVLRGNIRDANAAKQQGVASGLWPPNRLQGIQADLEHLEGLRLREVDA